MQPMICVLVFIFASGFIVPWLLARRKIDFEMLWSGNPAARGMIKAVLFLLLSALFLSERLELIDLEIGQLPVSVWYVLALQAFIWFRCLWLLRTLQPVS